MSDHGALPSFPGQDDDRALLGTGGDYASWGIRVAATIIDGLLLFAVANLLAKVAGLHTVFDAGQYHTVHGKRTLELGSRLEGVDVINSILTFVYATAFLGSKWFATLGMRVCGIHLQREDGGRPTYSLAAARTALFGVVGILASLVPLGIIVVIVDLLWPVWDARNQTVHDKIVHTVVVRGKTG